MIQVFFCGNQMLTLGHALSVHEIELVVGKKDGRQIHIGAAIQLMMQTAGN